MFLRKALKINGQANLRVLFYARYSTEEQDASSIPDQVAFCQRFLEANGITDAEITEISDPELSGELVSRPGIDKVRDGVGRRLWDLITVEDAGRLYRAVGPCLDLVEKAVDNEVRVICINDDVDTVDDLWHERLTEALSHHARSNRFTSQRIKRKHEALWRMGAAIGLVKPGYIRRPSVPARLGEPARGPFFDEKDPEWEAAIIEVYRRASEGEPPWVIADWVNTIGLPKTSNSKYAEYSEKNIVALIRRPDYRGEQIYRATVSKIHFGSGKRKPSVNTDEGGPLVRAMPHLRMVSDAMWYSANSAIDARDNRGGNYPRGLDHPQTGVPRDSRGPLSKNFLCGICGAKMHRAGRNEGGYRCCRAISLREPCWNKATALCDLTHLAIGKAISEQLIGSQEHLAELVVHFADTLRKQHSVEQRLAKAHAAESTLLNAIDSLSNVVERLGEGDNDAVDKLTEKLRSRGEELHRIRLDIGTLERLQNDQQGVMHSRDQIVAIVQRVSTQLLELDRECGMLVRQLAPRILAVPYRQFGSDKIVLRAKFDLSVVNLLPQQLRTLLAGDEAEAHEAQLLTIPMCIDLFKMSNSPKFGLRAFALKQQGRTLVDIAEELGISKRSAHLAAVYGKAMSEANISDPFPGELQSRCCRTVGGLSS